MEEGFIKLDGQDKPQKMFYEPKQKANNKTLADTCCKQLALSGRYLVF